MDVRKLGPVVRGVLRKTYEASKTAKKSWSNSSSQTETESESLLQNLSSFSQTHSDPVANLGLSWTSPKVEYVSSLASSEPRITVEQVSEELATIYPIKDRYVLHPESNGHHREPEEHDLSVDPEPLREKHRECTLVIHYSTFGNQDQAIMRSARIIGHLEMQGTEIIQATHNDIHIQGVREG